MKASPYDEFLETCFLSRYQENRDPWTQEKEIRFLTEIVAKVLEPGAKILDVGCGRGVDSQILLRAKHQVVGIDVVDAVPEAVKGDAGFAWREGSFFDFAEETPFDAVFDNGCFHHQLPEKDGDFFAKVRQVLKPGGHLALNVFSRGPDSVESFVQKIDGRRLSRYFCYADLRSILAQHGFRTRQVCHVRRTLFEGWYLGVVAEALC